MIELFFVACLKTMPAVCEERSLLSIENASLMGCMMQAQPQLAEWCESNPKLSVVKWSCRNASEREIRA